ncbi:MAG: DUF3540 domain-containing protein [Polyangiaceae bacterium]
MSNVIAFPTSAERAVPLPTGAPVWLGPATVVSAGVGSVELCLATGARTSAQLALAVPYEPVADDVVLAIGNADGFWVIGVVHGKGQTRMEVQGDLEVRATGALRLTGEAGVEVKGPEVSIVAGKLRSMARAATQSFENLYQRVSELWSVQAGSRHTVVEGESHEQAKSATVLTEEKMTINGKAIYLG